MLEDFNDGLKDAPLWGTDTAGTDTGSTEAVFEECNGRLEFHTQDTDFQEILRPLISGKPRYGENWEVTVDLSNRFAPETELPEAAIGLRIVSPADPTDFLETALLGYRGRSEIVNPAYSVLGNGVEQFALINSNFAALRVQFDSVRKQLHCDYDADGAVNGYSWTRFATYGINGSSGSYCGCGLGALPATARNSVFFSTPTVSAGQMRTGWFPWMISVAPLGRHVTGEDAGGVAGEEFRLAPSSGSRAGFRRGSGRACQSGGIRIRDVSGSLQPAGGSDVSGGAPRVGISVTADLP